MRYKNPVFTQIDGRYYLSGRKGKPITTTSWTEPPIIQYGFVISEDRKKLYSVLGDLVYINAEIIFKVFKYWVIYGRMGKQYITYLEPFGLGWEPTCEVPAAKIGLLSYDGCVVSNRPNSWEIYDYSFGSIYPTTIVPAKNVTPEKVPELVGKGFTPEYLIYLMNNKNIPPIDVNRSWAVSTEKFLKVITEIDKLSTAFSIDDLVNTLGVRKGIIMSIKQINKFIYFK